MDTLREKGEKILVKEEERGRIVTGFWRTRCIAGSEVSLSSSFSLAERTFYEKGTERNTVEREWRERKKRRKRVKEREKGGERDRRRKKKRRRALTPAHAKI